MYDAHIHLDQYSDAAIATMLKQVKGVIAVSTGLQSCQRIYRLASQYAKAVFPAYGFHPEQKLPDDLTALFTFIRKHHDSAIAIGEVGLPYYTAVQMEKEGKVLDYQPYLDLLDQFVQLAVELEKPIVLHAVHQDAPTVCEMLEKHGCTQAHFHWYKGDEATTNRMLKNGYYVSITPDIFYKQRAIDLVRQYPIEQLMVETDGPWQYEGPFRHQQTTPKMVFQVAEAISNIKQLPYQEVAVALEQNTRMFYQLP